MAGGVWAAPARQTICQSALVQTQALADTLANFRGHRVALLPPKRDVDSAEDLAALREVLIAF